MRCLIWAAVSSKEQVDKESIPSQIEAARHHISNTEGWHEAHEPLIIPGHTRRYTFLLDACDDMPEYATLMGLARAGEIDLVICRNRDRLGRTDSLIATLEQYLSDYSVQILSLDMPTRIVDPQEYATRKDKSAVWMRSVERAKAQAEVIELQERYRMGMHGRVRRGLHPNNCLPFGYRMGYDGVGVPYQPEVDLIRSIFAWYLKGASYQDIIDRCEIRSKSKVRYIVTNPYYAGYVSFSRRGIEADDPPTHKGSHEPIISEETWQAAQTEMQRRRGEGQRSPYTKYPLSGFVYCGYCGKTMIMDSVRAGGQRYRYYFCKSQECPRPDARNSVRADHLEEKVADTLFGWVRDSGSIEEYLAEYDKQSAGEARTQAELLSRAVTQKRSALDRWRHDYEGGLIERGEYYQHRHRLTEELQSLTAALDDAEHTLAPLDPAQVHQAVTVLTTERLWQNEPQGVKAILRRIGFRVTHKTGHIAISLAP